MVFSLFYVEKKVLSAHVPVKFPDVPFDLKIFSMI
jgi:hypothetical protein